MKIQHSENNMEKLKFLAFTSAYDTTVIVSENQITKSILMSESLELTELKNMLNSKITDNIDMFTYQTDINLYFAKSTNEEDRCILPYSEMNNEEKLVADKVTALCTELLNS